MAEVIVVDGAEELDLARIACPLPTSLAARLLAALPDRLYTALAGRFSRKPRRKE